MITLSQKAILIGIIYLLISFSLHAKTLREGDPIVLPELPDQFEKVHPLKKDTKWLVLAHDMDSSRITRDAFKGQTDASLQQAKIQYYADVSGMPGLITSYIAIPKMKKQKYTIVLGKEDTDLSLLPKKDDEVSVFKIKNNKIVQFVTVKNADELKKLVLK
jgi:hypothetical protein